MIQSARSEQIQSLKDELNAASESARKLFSSHSSDQLIRRPKAGSWSAAECLAHLEMTADSMVASIEEATEKARRESLHSPAPYKLDFMGKLFMKILEPPARFKAPAPTPFLPQTPASAQSALDGFLRSQESVIRALDAASAVSLVNAKVASPANAKIKYNLYSAFNILAAHVRRHLWQAANALKS